MSTDDGYGFVVRLEDMMTRLKAGKAVVNVGKGATALRPQRVHSYETDRVAAASTEGKLLVFEVAELPALQRGKGVQTIKLHRTPIAPEKVVGIAVVPAGRHADRAGRQALHESEGRRISRSTSASARSAVSNCRAASRPSPSSAPGAIVKGGCPRG